MFGRFYLNFVMEPQISLACLPYRDDDSEASHRRPEVRMPAWYQPLSPCQVPAQIAGLPRQAPRCAASVSADSDANARMERAGDELPTWPDARA